MAEPSDAALSNSFAVVSAVDHSGLLWIASILCAIYSILTASVRWSVKRKLLGLDDWLFGAALVSYAVIPFILPLLMLIMSADSRRRRVSHCLCRVETWPR